MALRLPYRAILTLGIATLALAAVPAGASAHTPAASRSQAAPTFVFPSNGQSFPLNGSMLFQVQPMSGAKGYLWSFVQGGAILYQNLAWTGHLDGATYSIKKGSTAEHRLHGGAMQVWVRAWMGGSRWSATSSVTVQLKGSQSGSGTKPKSGPPAAGTVLYQANWSSGLNGWTISPDWKTVSGELVNDGSNGDTTKLAYPPRITPYTPNCAVEADIQAIRVGRPCAPPSNYPLDSFGLSVRGESSGDYRVGLEGPVNMGQIVGDTTAFILDHASSDACLDPGYVPLAKSSYTLDNAWHTYRVEVRGNDIKFLIDGASVLETTDNHHLTGNSVGLWSNGVVLNVRSFKVIAL